MNENKILNIIFSYNRAMQLDCLIGSIISTVKNKNYELAIIFHTSDEHCISYKKLISKFEKYNFIKFYEREMNKAYFIKILPLLLNPTNLKRFVKYPYLRKNVDNFKFLLEDIIKNAKSKFIMFSTDDTIYDNEISIHDNLFKMIKENPSQHSYRLSVGKNVEYENIPNISFNKYLFWNYYDHPNVAGWKTPFIVDATIYHKETVYNILKKIIYHMPATLESYVNTYVMRKKMFGKGIAPEFSCISNIWLNRVQILGDHKSIGISVDFLNEKYLDGFEIEYIYDKPVNKWGLEPNKVIIKKGNIKEIVYDISKN